MKYHRAGVTDPEHCVPSRAPTLPWALWAVLHLHFKQTRNSASASSCFILPAFRGASPGCARRSALGSFVRRGCACRPALLPQTAVSDARVQLQNPRLTEARPRTAREVPAQPAGLSCSARLSGVFALVEPVLRPAVTHTSRGRHTGTAAGASHAGKGGPRTPEPRTPAPRTSTLLLLRSSLALTQLLLLCAASNSRPVVRIIRRPVRSLRLRRHGGRPAHHHAPAVLPVRDRGTTGMPHSARTPA